jgi:hypothetical protein
MGRHAWVWWRWLLGSLAVRRARSRLYRSCPRWKLPFLALDIENAVLQIQQDLAERSGGYQGVLRRDEPRSEDWGAPADPNLPEPVAAAVRGRDDYQRYVAPANDVPLGEAGEYTGARMGQKYALEAADLVFAYGAVRDAARRYAAAEQLLCGKAPAGFRAWQRRLTIAERLGDSATVRAMMSSPSRCAVDAAQRQQEAALLARLKGR